MSVPPTTYTRDEQTFSYTQRTLPTQHTYGHATYTYGISLLSLPHGYYQANIYTVMLSAEATTPTRIYIHTKAIQVRTNEEYTQHTHALNVFKKFVSSKLIFTVRRHTYYIYVYLHATP